MVPALLSTLDIVRDNFEAFAKSLPDTSVYYAVKANPAPEILNLLESLGSSFDCASVGEIEMVLATGADADRISYGNTIKKERDIARAFEYGVRLFAVDCVEEVEKIARVAPDPRLLPRPVRRCRRRMAAVPQVRLRPEMAPDVLEHAHRLGLEAYGVSFHVGSQQANLKHGISLSPWRPASSAKWRCAASS
jgi:ornithine decarboxylase